ncbi:RNA polymerase factor sigma-54 [Aliibacillus thermotolerans]|uniref:RNA polymerase factor sigma-54 n=1 Tax=Aliibacillus thermotolerans TaxID=1834418 RepID=A0ABW0U286_9BACI|nr:RNA polymerase factor sigma-54 [Aliibacillus thermotolerans]MDA3128726.1 RNA polymerase factor sigma-54 [Aliibacillus thermotolerans]
MNLEMNIVQKQTMNVVMTQELRQAITLLQFSTQELSEYLEEKALENPLIEMEEKQPVQKEESLYHMPVMWREEPSENDGVHDDEEEYSPFDRIIVEQIGVADYLNEQIGYMDVDEKERALLQYLANNVEDTGYLVGTYEEAATLFPISKEEYENAIAKIQRLDPAGIGARSFQECLLIQLKRYYPENPLAMFVVEYYLEELAERKWKELSKILDVSLEEIQAVYDLIQSLDPRPGARFGKEAPGHLVPDVYVEKNGEEFIVRLNDDSLPKIRLNRHYRHLLENPTDSEATDYAKRKYDQLVWLLKSIDQRQQTIRRITETIVKYQRAFFEKGPMAIKPLTLKEVAEEAEVHESTVSRTTTQKYVQTPHGLYELKYFFTTGVGEGRQTSTTTIKQLLQEMIDQEDKRKPLSDQKIADKMNEEHGIKVSRRAIAKYRGELNILSSTKRKRYS